MLHPLAQTEIDKLQAHGITALTYDEIASLQDAARAVDEAVKSEGLPTGCTRPVRLTGTIVLFPITIAASAALERVRPWIDNAAETLALAALAWLLAHGRDPDLLDRTTTDRATFIRTIKSWRRSLPITTAELAAAVDAVFEVEAGAAFRVDLQALATVTRYAEAQGDAALSEAICALRVRLLANRRQITQPHVARPSWGIITHRLAALTGCTPDAWRIAPTAEALDAYAARFDFASLSSGLGGNKAADPAERAQRDALRHLFATTDAIARAHRKEAP